MGSWPIALLQCSKHICVCMHNPGPVVCTRETACLCWISWSTRQPGTQFPITSEDRTHGAMPAAFHMVQRAHAGIGE